MSQTFLTGISLIMPDVLLQSSDQFRCETIVTNATEENLLTYPAYPVGETLVTVTPEFTWSSAGTGTVTWHVAITDPGMTSNNGELDTLEFGWE